jgi:hypothetical protein
MAALKPSTLEVINKLGDYRHEFGMFIAGRHTEPRIERRVDQLLEAGLDLRAYTGAKDAFLENMEFRIKGIAVDLMKNVTPFLHQKGLLAKAFQVMPDPTACSYMLQRAYLSSESKSLQRCAEAALDLGSVMTVEDMMSVQNVMRHHHDHEPFKINPDFALKLIENMSRSSWAINMERKDSHWIWNKFIFDSLCNLGNQGHYKKVVDHVFANEDVYKNVKGDRHSFMVQLSLGMQDVRYFSYLAAQNKQVYDDVMSRGFVKSCLHHLITCSSNEFDVGKLPDMSGFSDKFFINCFADGVMRHNLSEREYKGLQRHWKALGYGNGKSLAEVASKTKELKEKVHVHRNVVSMLDDRIKDKSLFLQANSTFHDYARGNYQLIEKLYFTPEDRVCGNPDREKALFKCVIVLADNICYDFVERHRAFLQDPSVFDLMVNLKAQGGSRFTRDRIHDFAGYMMGLMLEDDPTGFPISHFTKEVFDDFVGGRDSVTDEQIRSINWKSSVIKREFLENDMEL